MPNRSTDSGEMPRALTYSRASSASRPSASIDANSRAASSFALISAIRRAAARRSAGESPS